MNNRFAIRTGDFRLEEVAEQDVFRKLTAEEATLALRGARPICSSEQDDDFERFFLTVGGQFVRQTPRSWFLCAPGHARDLLAGWCADDVLEELVEANAFGDIVSARAAPGRPGQR